MSVVVEVVTDDVPLRGRAVWVLLVWVLCVWVGIEVDDVEVEVLVVTRAVGVQVISGGRGQ